MVTSKTNLIISLDRSYEHLQEIAGRAFLSPDTITPKEFDNLNNELTKAQEHIKKAMKKLESG